MTKAEETEYYFAMRLALETPTFRAQMAVIGMEYPGCFDRRRARMEGVVGDPSTPPEDVERVKEALFLLDVEQRAWTDIQREKNEVGSRQAPGHGERDVPSTGKLDGPSDQKRSRGNAGTLN